MEFKSGEISGNTLSGTMQTDGSAENKSFLSLIAVGYGGQAQISGGKISDNLIENSIVDQMSIISVTYGGKLTMNSGEISRNTLSDLGAPPAGGTGGGGFAAEKGQYRAGTISVGMGAAASRWNDEELASFTMDGGKISDNRAPAGSAVSVLPAGKAVFGGGTISGNLSTDSTGAVLTPGDGKWESWMSPIYSRRNTAGADGNSALIYLEGSGCIIEDPIYLGRQISIILDEEIRQPDRVYEVYPETVSLSDVIVQPDGQQLASAAPFLGNFNIHALGRAADTGMTEDLRETSTVPLPESSLIQLFKPVFVNGDTGVDPYEIRLKTGEVFSAQGVEDDDLGLTPTRPVKTFDAAKLLGQAKDKSQQDPWERHIEHKNYYIIYATGPIHSEYTSTRHDLSDPDVANYVDPINPDGSGTVVFKLQEPAHVSRYTNFQVHLGNGLHFGGGSDTQQYYNYGNIFDFSQDPDDPSSRASQVVLRDIRIAGRREVDDSSKNGDSLIRVGNGVELTLADGVGLERNNATGYRPDDRGSLTIPIEKGGGIYIEAGGSVKTDWKNSEDLGSSAGQPGYNNPQMPPTTNRLEALYGSAVYVEGCTLDPGDPNKVAVAAGVLELAGTVSFSGDLYFAGEQPPVQTGAGPDAERDNTAHLKVGREFALPDADAKLTLNFYSDWQNRLVVMDTTGSPLTIERQSVFALPDWITAAYEITLTGNSGNEMRLNRKLVYFLDPIGGNDQSAGATPETAIQTLDGLYQQLASDIRDDTGDNGAVVYVMNPIYTQTAVVNGASSSGGNGAADGCKPQTLGLTPKQGSSLAALPAGRTLNHKVTLRNAYYEENNKRHYYSQLQSYWKDQSGNLYSTSTHNQTDETDLITVPAQVYFKRYSKPEPVAAGGTVPSGYNRPTYTGALFSVSGSSELALDGIYIDGHSRALFDEPNQVTYPAVTAMAPLIWVDRDAMLSGSTGTVDIQYNGGAIKKCSIGSTLLSNNRNMNPRSSEPGADENGDLTVDTGSSAGIENFGSVELAGTEFSNLELGDGITGGTSVYQSGKKFSVEAKVRFNGGSVYLEGKTAEHTYDGQIYPHWLTVRTSGIPIEGQFDFLMRDAYDGRPAVEYPADGIIQPQDISTYRMNSDVSRYYSLIERPRTEQNFPREAKVVFLIMPDAIYLNPVSGDDTKDGLMPNSAVKTLRRAYEQLASNSSKAIYIMEGPVPLDRRTEITHEYLLEAGNDKKVSNQVNSFVSFRRYVKPAVGEDPANPYYQDFANTESYDGVLFDIKGGGQLSLLGDVEIFGHNTALYDEQVPERQQAQSFDANAPMMQIRDGGVLRLGHGVALRNNTNKNGGGTDKSLYGGAANIASGGSMYMEGGVWKDNKSTPIGMTGLDETDAATASATGVYNAGVLEVIEAPEGIPKDQTICLDENSYIVMNMLLGSSDVFYTIDIIDPAAGRDVISYKHTGVDAEYIHYELGASVLKDYFLVEAQDNPSVLELQDWKVLGAEIPQEVFLGVHEQFKDGPIQVSRVDTAGGYDVPVYSIKNNGTHPFKVTVTAFPLVKNKEDTAPVVLVESLDKLNDSQPRLYLALAASDQPDDKFAQSLATPLVLGAAGQMTERELGILQNGESGTFTFEGQANAAFMQAFEDPAFPDTGSAGGGDLAEIRRDYMRTKDETANKLELNQAAAWYKLQYRIEMHRLP